MNKLTRKYVKIIAVFLFIVVLGAVSLGCPGSDSGSTIDNIFAPSQSSASTEKTTTATGQPTAPVDVSVDKASSSIGTSGGSVKLDTGATLTVPAHTVSATTSMSLEQLSNPDNLGQDDTAYDITGLGSVSGQVTLTFPVNEGLTEQEVAVYGCNVNDQAYLDIPYVYDAAASQVTVTINPSQIIGAVLSNLKVASTGAPAGGQMAIAPARDIAGLNFAGLWERFRILFTPEQAYVPAHTEHMVSLPYYEQTGGSCWAVDTNMLIAGFVPGDQRQHQGHPLSAAKASDTDFGIMGSGLYFQELLSVYLSAQTGATVTWRGFIDAGHLRWRILRELDAGHPLIIDLPNNGTGHYALIIGYQNSGDSFILQDSKGTSPPTNDEGGMYTIRPWAWMENAKGGALIAQHIMWAEATPAPDSLLSIACPGANEGGGANLGNAFFYTVNPKNQHQVPVATLQFHPSSVFGIRWEDKLATVDVVPNTATGFNLKTKMWNADFAADSVDVRFQVRKDADVFFTQALGTYQLPAANYNTTNPVEVSADIATEDMRDLSKADASGRLDEYIDVMMMRGNTICDYFSVEAILNVIPQIDEVTPATFKAGDTLEITGSCFGKDESTKSDVLIDGESMDILDWSDTGITVQVPDDFEGEGDVMLQVNTGSQYTYESNEIKLSATTNQSYQINRTWNIKNTDIDGVMNARFDWVLSGMGDNVIYSESEDEITIQVLPNVPLRLAVNCQVSMQNSQFQKDAGDGWYFVKTYYQPQLLYNTADQMLDIGGNFKPNFSCSGNSINADFTFTDEFQALTLTVIYGVHYDQTLYDDKGVAQDTEIDEEEWGATGIQINIEAYEPYSGE